MALAFICILILCSVVATNRLLFSVEEALGIICRESGAQAITLPRGHWLVKDGKVFDYLTDVALGAAAGQIPSYLDDPFEGLNLPVFSPSEPCQSMKVRLEKGGRYLIQIENTQSFKDKNGRINAGSGYNSSDPQITTTLEKLKVIALTPFRRHLLHPWFRISLMVGAVGGEVFTLDPPTQIAPSSDVIGRLTISKELVAPRDGELFIYVNNAVISVPRLYDVFYKDNSGSTKVGIRRLDFDPNNRLPGFLQDRLNREVPKQ